jgi:methionyl-tRNA formyltransferase
VRVLFLGTPEFAVPTLQHLLDFPKVEVVGVVTQPDRPAGRGNKMHPPPTKILAEQHGIPVLQPVSLAKSPEIVEQMRALNSDVIVMVAFGQILKKAVLTMPPLGVINVHASLLPHYRGAAPLNWSIINGDTVTGVTTMFTEAGVDTGPMLLKKEVEIGPDMTSEELAQLLSYEGAVLLIQTLEKLIDKTLVAERQDDALATFAPMMNKDLGHIDWSQSPHKVHNLVRGIIPWPGAYTKVNDTVLKIWKTRLNATPEHIMMEPGCIVLTGDRIQVVCGQDERHLLELVEVQPPGKPRMAARAWANGSRIQTGVMLG